MVLLPCDVVDPIREDDLDALLDGSEFSGTHHSSLVKCTVGLAVFDINWYGVRDEAECKHGLFCFYDYDIGPVYSCDDQIGYVLSGDRRTYRTFDIHLLPSAMSLEQYRANSALFAERSPLYVWDSWMHHASSPYPVPPHMHLWTRAHTGRTNIMLWKKIRACLRQQTTRIAMGLRLVRLRLVASTSSRYLTASLHSTVRTWLLSATLPKRTVGSRSLKNSWLKLGLGLLTRELMRTPMIGLQRVPNVQHQALSCILLRWRVKSAEAAAHEIYAARERLSDQIVTLNARVADMLVAMRKPLCPLEQMRLSLVGLRMWYTY